MKLKKASVRHKRSFTDHMINYISGLIIILFVVNEFSHVWRMPESISKSPILYEHHFSWSYTFPFIGSYFLIKPADYNPKKTYPLVVALHGVSSRVYSAEELVKPEFRKAFPAFIMVPVAPARAFWATPENASYQMKRNIPYPDHLPQVMEGIKDISLEYTIDNERIYITGHSMGATGVIGALERYPDVFAAGIASAGSWNPNETKNLNDPLWIFHGNIDEYIPYEVGLNLGKELKKRGLSVNFNAIKGKGHDIGPLVYSKQKLWTWLFNKKNNKV